MSRTVDLTPVPIWVPGKGLVSPPGWISPETRALMQKAQDDCAAYQAAKASRSAGETVTPDAPTTPDTTAPDPWGDLK